MRFPFGVDTFPNTDFNKVNLDYILEQLGETGRFWEGVNPLLISDEVWGPGVAFDRDDLSGHGVTVMPEIGDGVFYQRTISGQTVAYFAYLRRITTGEVRYEFYDTMRLTGPQGEQGEQGPQGIPGEVQYSDIASAFSISDSYANGDYVFYNGSLYRFTDDHATGAWTGTDAIAVALAEDVSNLSFTLYNLADDCDDGIFSIRNKTDSWVVGTLVNGTVVANSHRVTCRNSIVFDRDATIYVESGRRCALQRYVNNVWVDDGWQTGSFTVSANVPFKVVISPTTTTGAAENAWTGNIEQYTHWVTYKTAIRNELDTIESNQTELFLDIDEFNGISHTFTFTASGEQILNHCFVVGNYYRITNNTSAYSGEVRLIRSDNTYTVVGTVPNGNSITFIPNEAYVKIRVYANATGTFVLTSDGVGVRLTEVDTASRTIINGNALKESEFNAVFFSDIHGAADNFKKIVSYANTNKTDLNVVLNGGDTVLNLLDEGLTWYNNLVDLCEVDVLNCVGNHDSWKGSNGTSGTPQEIYNLIIAKVASSVSDLHQPNAAATNGLCYYYKDYGNVRVMVLDAMFNETWFPNNYNSAQRTWVQSVLNDAITNSKHVICLVHPPFYKGRATLVDSVWTGVEGYGTVYDYVRVSNDALADIKSFIQAGGNFVCWLSGHIHRDNLIYDSNYPEEFMINIASARYNYHPDMFVGKDNRCFDVISVDTDNSFIKVQRIGIDMDYGMKQRNYLCYDYANKKIIAER